MIKSFQHKGLEKFFRSNSKAGIIPSHAAKLSDQLTRLEFAHAPEDLDVPGYFFHRLHGNLAGHWSIRVNGNWRLTFTFSGNDAELVDYTDYH
ncbi:MAG: type II toxin-antitoxin system RelE/ParE family toxin [Bryocella sp.]